jgi:quercetin dioxygenase-like cupin family protein
MSSVDRETLLARLRQQGLEPSSWSNEPGFRYAQHSHDFDKVVVAVEGSITFGLTGYGVGIMLTPGERLDLPAHVEHDAVVSARGVSCLEVHLPPGTLGIKKAAGRGYRW